MAYAIQWCGCIFVQLVTGSARSNWKYDETSYLCDQSDALAILCSVPLVILFHGKFVSPIQSASEEGVSNNRRFETTQPLNAKLHILLLPIILLLFSILTIATITGHGNPVAGDMTNAIYWSGFTALIGSEAALCLSSVKIDVYTDWSIEGIKQELPALIILILAFTLGSLLAQLKTGVYIANFLQLNHWLWVMPAAIFVTACVVSFSTGSSGLQSVF
ncbi:Na+/H+ antiporter NhaC family protein [Vibrio aestuarianus]|uniref:Na+/H+ antiporter NhaC family protein n=1 Tax=Vibrio aestuarianus TaxID=28171 RepID=UPI00237CCD26|nr:Na+/H+ antiporter NhaC family protein [Vibrio aestuarianus]MDE1239972.1 hypothetical protein [Vibrio aestuarianus]